MILTVKSRTRHAMMAERKEVNRGEQADAAHERDKGEAAQPGDADGAVRRHNCGKRLYPGGASGKSPDDRCVCARQREFDLPRLGRGFVTVRIRHIPPNCRNFPAFFAVPLDSAAFSVYSFGGKYMGRQNDDSDWQYTG